MKGLSRQNLYGLRRLQGGLLALFTLLILLVLNSSAWWIYHKVDRYLDEHFSRSLQEAAELAAMALAQNRDIGLPAPEPNSTEYIELETRLLKLQDAGNFTDLILIDPSYRNIAGVYPDFEIGKVDNVMLLLDKELLSQARSGRTALTEGFDTGGYFLKTAYTPLTDVTGNVTAILVAKADVEYHRPKLAIRNTLTIMTGLSGLAVLLLAFIYWRSLRALQKSEEQVMHNERLASLGQLAAGIAHELRNPLSIIEQTVTILKRRYQKEPDELFEYIPSEVSRMNRIITEFLDLARQSPLRIQETDLTAVLKRTLNLLQFQLQKEGIEMECRLPEGMPVAIDPEKIQQVFLNLCLNAIDSMPAGGKLSVSIENSSRQGWVCARVKDDGKGIPREQLEKIFDPFFTTKETGTGLGLSVARQIVAQHGGKMEIDSTLGEGTEVKVFLRIQNPED